jgi:hypothetical protein
MDGSDDWDMAGSLFSFSSLSFSPFLRGRCASPLFSFSLLFLHQHDPKAGFGS